MKTHLVGGAAALGLLLGACSGGGYGTVGPTDTSSGNGNPGGNVTPPSASTALFQLSAGVLPYPTDLYFAGSTDGTINIQPPNAAMPNQAAINALDGFSTTAVIRERFGGALDPTTLAAGVIVVPVTTDNGTKATIGVLGAPLTAGVDYSVGLGEEAGVGNTILEITPLHPLNASTCIANGQFLGANCTTGNGYLVLLTNAIKDTAGNPAVPDTDYTTIKTALAGGATCPGITDPTLNAVCQLTGAHLQIAQQALHLNPANIVLSFSFTTQSTLDTLALMSATAQPQSLKVNPTGLTTADLGLGLPGHADLYVGVLSIPYYLSRSAPLTEYWHAPPFPLDPTSTFVTRYNPLPAATQTLLIPVLVSVPNAASALGAVPPANGWPVTIFQHGITRNREDMFAVADSFADSGSVVIAIDLPLHGVTNTADPFYAAGANPLYTGLGLPASGSIERTFDLDVENNTTGAAGADGQIDPSGSHFINLTSVLTTRDNLREGVTDLVTLTRTLPTLNLGAAGGANPAAIHYLGHSLGAIEGATYLAVVGPQVQTATLAMPGGGLADLLRESPTFAPQINAGLAAQGVTQGTTLYEQFFRDAQTAVDSGDPVNFIPYATVAHPIHLIQVVGSASSPPDQVVPNTATARLITASSYLPGATAVPLAQLGSATPGPQVNPQGFRAFVNFTAGDHGSIIDPSGSAQATQEMQLEALTFAGFPVPAVPFPATPAGTTILIGDPTVIQP